MRFESRPTALSDKQMVRLLEDMEKFEIIRRDKRGRPLYKCRKDIFLQPRKEINDKRSPKEEIALLRRELDAAKALMKAGGPYPDPEGVINRWVESEEDADWMERFSAYGEKVGAKPEEWLIFEGSMTEWTERERVLTMEEWIKLVESRQKWRSGMEWPSMPSQKEDEK